MGYIVFELRSPNQKHAKHQRNPSGFVYRSHLVAKQPVQVTVEFWTLYSDHISSSSNQGRQKLTTSVLLATAHTPEYSRGETDLPYINRAISISSYISALILIRLSKVKSDQSRNHASRHSAQIPDTPLLLVTPIIFVITKLLFDRLFKYTGVLGLMHLENWCR